MSETVRRARGSAAWLELRAAFGYADGVTNGERSGVTYLWDFFGPNAEGTAAHFEVHLREFLDKNGITGCETGTESEGDGHRAARCAAPEPNVMIEKALRPRRQR